MELIRILNSPMLKLMLFIDEENDNSEDMWF